MTIRILLQREKTNERVGSTYKEIMDDAFASPYILQMAE